jgi:hypothetical protein
VVGWLLKAVHEKDVSASPTPKSLAEDNRGLIVAARYMNSKLLHATGADQWVTVIPQPILLRMHFTTWLSIRKYKISSTYCSRKESQRVPLRGIMPK